MTDNKKPDDNMPEPVSEFPLLKDDFAPDVEARAKAEPVEPAAIVADAAPTSSPQPPNSGVIRVSPLAETLDEPITVSRHNLQMKSRRDFLALGAGAAAVAAGFWWLLPEETQQRPFTAAERMKLDSLEARLGISPTRSASRKDAFLKRTLDFDDDVAEALYSPNRTVPTYHKSQITPNLRNNYDGQTPDPDYIPDWTLSVEGLASGKTETLKIHDLLSHFSHHDEVTRLCCVEGWSAIAWWGGLLFADFLKAYPPKRGAKWARMDSDVNLDSDGNADPYYVSIDLGTARHPQTLLVTHHGGKPLEVDHGAPLRLIAPMKLGLKNIKAITKITYTVHEPPDYWNERGYSKYDGL